MSQAFSLTPRGLKNVSVSNTVTVPAAATTQLIELNLSTSVEKVSFQVDNITQALDQFIIEGRVHQDASYFTIASAAGDFSAPTGRLMSATGSLVTLAAAASGRFDLDVSGLYSVRISASAASDSAVATIYASGSAGAPNPNISVVTDTGPLPAGTNLIGKVGIDQTTPGTTNKVTASGLGYVSQPSFNRTTDSNAYTANDVVGSATAGGGAVITFTNIGAAAGDIIITDTDLMLNTTSVPAGMTSFRLHLYNATPPGNLGDNAAWALPAGDQTAYLGYIDLGSPAVMAGTAATLFVETSGINKKLRMGATGSLFGYLVTNGGCTIPSATTIYPRLNAVGV